MEICERYEEGEDGRGTPDSARPAASGEPIDGWSRRWCSEDGGGAERELLRAPSPVAADALSELGERIALLSAQISAATYELLVMLREFDERGGWNTGFRSCAHWLVWR